MPELDFEVQRAEVVPYAASPQLALKLRITQARQGDRPLEAIHTVALRCQVRLEPGRRRYSATEQKKLLELYGEPHRWGQTVRGMLWVNATANVPSFVEQVTIDLPLPCSYDFNLAQTKYFHALEDGQIPVCLLFSGTIFYADDDGSLQVSQISWEKETNFRLDVSLWKRMMEIYYPNSAWLCLRRDVFDELYAYKSQRAIATWEQAIESLLAEQRVTR